MEFKIVTETQTEEMESGANTLESVMRKVGEWLQGQTAFPLRWIVDCGPYGSATYEIVPRRDDGPTDDVCAMVVNEVEFGIEGLLPGRYEEKYLTCVEPDTNRYKFYRMIPVSEDGLSDDGISVVYGRISEYGRETFYDSQRLFWLKYAEKILKGYTDESEVYLGEKPDAAGRCERSYPAEAETPSQQLFNKLLAYAQNRVRESLLNPDVTIEQAERSRELLSELGSAESVEEFNGILVRLLAVSPRPIRGFKDRGVKSLLAVTSADYENVIDREESLVAAMEAVAGNGQGMPDGEGSFASLGIEVHDATEEQAAEVMKHLGDGMASRVRHIWRVIPLKQRERFNEWMHDRGITDVRQLWHGSRNENWLSIIEHGLLLNPNAQITGKMFGNGIYTAISADKSFGYTSHRGSRWARGCSSEGIMGLYACAYGTPHRVEFAQAFDQEGLDELGCDCVHAYAGRALRNDEIVFYSEAALLLNYIVSFE